MKVVIHALISKPVVRKDKTNIKRLSTRAIDLPYFKHFEDNLSSGKITNFLKENL